MQSKNENNTDIQKEFQEFMRLYLNTKSLRKKFLSHSYLNTKNKEKFINLHHPVFKYSEIVRKKLINNYQDILNKIAHNQIVSILHNDDSNPFSNQSISISINNEKKIPIKNNFDPHKKTISNDYKSRKCDSKNLNLNEIDFSYINDSPLRIMSGENILFKKKNNGNKRGIQFKNSKGFITFYKENKNNNGKTTYNKDQNREQFIANKLSKIFDGESANLNKFKSINSAEVLHLFNKTLLNQKNNKIAQSTQPNFRNSSYDSTQFQIGIKNNSIFDKRESKDKFEKELRLGILKNEKKFNFNLLNRTMKEYMYSEFENTLSFQNRDLMTFGLHNKTENHHPLIKNKIPNKIINLGNFYGISQFRKESLKNLRNHQALEHSLQFKNIFIKKNINENPINLSNLIIRHNPLKKDFPLKNQYLSSSIKKTGKYFTSPNHMLHDRFKRRIYSYSVQ